MPDHERQPSSQLVVGGCRNITDAGVQGGGAEEMDNGGTKLFFCKPWFILLVVCLCFAGSVAGVILSTQNNAEPDAQLRSWLVQSKGVSEEAINSSPDSFEMAVQWSANEDEARKSWLEESDDPWNFHRFLLLWLYFATSSNGIQVWKSCGPPDHDSGDLSTCKFFLCDGYDWESGVNVKDTSALDVSYTSLSKNRHCEWPGVVCYEHTDCGDSVTALQLHAFGLSGRFPTMINYSPCLMNLTSRQS